MIDNRLIAAATRSIAALDLSAEDEAIQVLQGELTSIDTALDAANDRLGEIAKALAAPVAADGEAVADALIQGADAQNAASAGPAREALRNERDSLRAGIEELAKRAAGARLEISRIRDKAFRRAAEAAKPIGDAIEAELRGAAETIAACYAATQALAGATNGFALLSMKTRNAAKGCIGPDASLDDLRQIDVPDYVTQALAPLSQNGLALKPVRIARQVSAP